MKNSTGRKLLEQRYGKGCFMERAGIRKITPEQEEKYKKIFGFKKLDRTISYHHIKERSKGEKFLLKMEQILLYITTNGSIDNPRKL